MLALLKRIPLSLVALAIIPVVHLAYVLMQWHHIPLHDGVPIGQGDPDTWLRLTLVREWLTGGGWYSHTVSGSNAPFEATISPWTRPLDVVIALFTYMQPENIDINLRLMRASLLLPCLWTALLVAGMHRLMRLIMPLPSAYVMAAVLIAGTPPLFNYFGLGNADHHAPLAVLFVWAMGGVFATTTTSRLMLFSGLLLGLQLWISVEAFVLIGLIYCCLGIEWLGGNRRKGIELALLATSTAITSIIAIMIERHPSAWDNPIYDSISTVYAYPLALTALLAWALHAFFSPSLSKRLYLSGIAGLIWAIAIGIVCPDVLRGPFYGAAPFIHSDFLPSISEAKPFYKLGALPLMSALLLPLAALALCVASFTRKEPALYRKDIALKLVFFMMATLALYATQQRFSYYLIPITIVAMAPFLGALFTPENNLVAPYWPATRMLALTETGRSKIRLPLVLSLIGLPMGLLFLNTLPAFSSSTTDARLLTQQRDGCYRVARQLIRSGEINRALPEPLTLWAPTDIGMEILFFTHHRIIASNYHREGEAIKYVWDTDKITSPTRLRKHLATRNVGAMLICPTSESNQGSLIQSYLTQQALPAWLTPIAYRRPTPPKDKHQNDSPPPLSPFLVKVTPQ